jgi:hypothetical protein
MPRTTGVPAPVRLTAHGHPDVTGRHRKTLELTADPRITARASCVVGVAAELPPELRGLRGVVRLDLMVDGLAASVSGEVNPGYASAERLVVRRSDVLDPDTFLVNASVAAADLPRPLVAALADPAALVSVTATELGAPDPVLLVLTPGSTPPPLLSALVAAADVAVDLTGSGVAAPAVALPARRVHGWPASLDGARTVVVLADLATVRLPEALSRRRVVTWPPAYPGAELLLAAGLPLAPALQAGPLPTGARALRSLATTLTAVPCPAVLLTSGDGVDPLRALLPGHTVLLPDPAVGWGTGVVSVPPGEAVGLAGLAGLRRSPALVLCPPQGSRPVGTDAARLSRLLREAGVSGRTAAGVLTALGVPRREAYQLATGA